jgi:hypothetical protein
MSTAKVESSLMLKVLAEAVVSHELYPTDSDTRTGQPMVVPRDLRRFLARLRLLEGVPFAYLVADSQLLPPESIRFFYLDRNWTDALIQGALSVGTFNSSDRAQLEQLYARIRGEIDKAERNVRLPGGERVQDGPAGVITGFLLRSRAVSGWPGMHVRAYARDVVGDEEIVGEEHPDRLKLLRLERLAPAVMLALFDGIPRLVHLEEPRQGLQFGVHLAPVGDTGNFSATVRARDRNTSEDVEPQEDMKVFFRRDAPGVLDLRRTAQEFVDTPSTNTGPALDGAEFALQMIRFPYRQVFGRITASPPIAEVFRPTIGYTINDLEVVFRGNVS